MPHADLSLCWHYQFSCTISASGIEHSVALMVQPDWYSIVNTRTDRQTLRRRATHYYSRGTWLELYSIMGTFLLPLLLPPEEPVEVTEPEEPGQKKGMEEIMHGSSPRRGVTLRRQATWRYRRSSTNKRVGNVSRRVFWLLKRQNNCIASLPVLLEEWDRGKRNAPSI